MKKRKFDTEKEALADVFGDVFHSFKDIYKVAPIQLLERLERKGVVLARKPKGRKAAVGNARETS